MYNLPEIKDLLQKILRTNYTQRAEYISTLQNKIWDETNKPNEDLREVLSDLAYDLNFYENDPRDRDESLGYYDDKRLSEIITAALEKINR